MWVVDGPFDGLPEVGSATKRKLMLPGKTYIVGRKNKDLTIAGKAVGREHASLTVSQYAAEDADKSDFVPSLTYAQIKKAEKGSTAQPPQRARKAAIARPGWPEPLSVDEGSTGELKSNDTVHINGGDIKIRVEWIPVNILLTYGKVPSSERSDLKTNLLNLGIRTTKTWSSSVTHVLAHSIMPPYDWGLLTALVTSAQIVTLKWANEFVRRSRLERGLDGDDQNLEDQFNWVSEDQYRPQNFDPKWNPDQSRKAVFEGLQFVILARGDPPSALLELVKLSGGSYQRYDVSEQADAATKFMERLSSKKAKDKKPSKPGMESSIVLVGDKDELQQDVESLWQKTYQPGIAGLGMRTIWKSEMADALLKMDMSIIDSTKVDQASTIEKATDFLPLPRRANKSITPTPSQPSIRKAQEHPSNSSIAPQNEHPILTSPSTSDQMLLQPPLVEAVAPIPKTLNPQAAALPRRRANARTAQLVLNPTTTQTLDSNEGPKGLPPRRAKRPNSAASPAVQEGNPVVPTDNIKVEEEPPHKRFKALFEGTQAPESIPEETDSGPTFSQKDSDQTKKRKRGVNDMDMNDQLDALPTKRHQLGTDGLPGSSNQARQSSVQPEFPLSQQQTASSSRMEIQRSQTKAPTSSSKAAVPKVESTTQRKPKAEPTSPIKKATGGGNIVGTHKEPDQEPRFLQALNSRTKGKRKEDEFDRQFNQLRIAVPTTHEDEEKRLQQEHEQAVWNDFDKDPNVRGNFMVVEYTNLLRRDGGSRLNGPAVTYATGVPNFKKFKKKIAPGTRAAIVDVELPPTVDYGMGDEYWQAEANTTFAGADAIGSSSQAPNPTLTARKKVPNKPFIVIDSDSDDAPVLPRSKSRRAAEADKPVTKDAKGKLKKPPPKKFVDRIPDFDLIEEESGQSDSQAAEQSEIFDMNVSADDEEASAHGYGSTLKSSASQTRSRRTPISAPPKPIPRTRAARTPSVPPPSATTQRSSKTGSAVKRKPAVVREASDDSDAPIFRTRKRTKAG